MLLRSVATFEQIPILPQHEWFCEHEGKARRRENSWKIHLVRGRNFLSHFRLLMPVLAGGWMFTSQQQDAEGSVKWRRRIERKGENRVEHSGMSRSSAKWMKLENVSPFCTFGNKIHTRARRTQAGPNGVTFSSATSCRVGEENTTVRKKKNGSQWKASHVDVDKGKWKRGKMENSNARNENESFSQLPACTFHCQLSSELLSCVGGNVIIVGVEILAVIIKWDEFSPTLAHSRQSSWAWVGMEMSTLHGTESSRP